MLRIIRFLGVSVNRGTRDSPETNRHTGKAEATDGELQQWGHE